tara:strand:+ start:13873 stop:14394 length:522 start_codon:yes stop_codon:yes gene_type:complete
MTNKVTIYILFLIFKMARVIDGEIDTQIQQDSDEDIQHHHNLERQNLVEQVQAHAKKPTCRKMVCKGLVLSVAGVLFLLMMIQLWSDYGEYIQTQTFPPKMISMGSYCKNETSQASYKPMECAYTDNLVCTIEKPSKPFVQACPPSMISWTDNSLIVEPYEQKDCIDLVVWSI